jgi:hypothetical protein
MKTYSPPKTHDSTETKWTVLFLVHAIVDETRVYSERLLKELLQANIDPDKAQLFVLRSTYDYSDNSALYAELSEIKKSDSGTNQIVPQRPFKIKTLDQFVAMAEAWCKDNNVKRHTPEKIAKGDESFDLAKEDSLVQVITHVKQRAEKNAPKSKFILVTWDHSFGFGTFATDQSGATQLNIRKSTKKLDTLLINELANAIERVFGTVEKDEGLEILLMMNCWMQSIETGYQLRDVVKILIAPETVFDFLGYDYRGIVERISGTHITEGKKDPAITDEEELATNIIKDIKPRFENIDVVEHLDNMIISATRPPHSVKIKEQIDHLTDPLNKMLTENYSVKNLTTILSARARCKEITDEGVGIPWYFVDIFQAMEKLKPVFKNDPAQSLEKVFDSYIIKDAIQQGKNFQERFYKGVSICFPYKNDEFILGDIYKIYYSVNSTDRNKFAFAKASKWPTFLDNLLTNLKRQQIIEAKRMTAEQKDDVSRTTITPPSDKELLAPPQVKNFQLDLSVNFSIVSATFELNSLTANCFAIDNGKGTVLFQMGGSGPKNTGPGNPKNIGPGNPKNIGPGNTKNIGPGSPFEGDATAGSILRVLLSEDSKEEV